MELDFEALLNEKPYLQDIRKIDLFKYELIYSLRNGRDIPLIIYFDKFFPSRLPIISINEKLSPIPKIPHVLKSGGVCYIDTEGVIWNQNPQITLDFVFERVERVLLSTPHTIEYHREFSYYFGTQTEKKWAIANYEIQTDLDEVNVWTIKNRPVAFLGKNKKFNVVIEKFFNAKVSTQNLGKATFISLDKIYSGDVPQYDKNWSYQEIIKIVKENISSQKLDKLKILIANKKDYYYLLQLPLLTGNKVVIGLWYQKTDLSFKQKTNPIIDETVSDKFKVTPIEIYQINDDTLVQRGGGVKKNPNILLVGCGAVGSDLLFLLVRSGLKNFTLIDKDYLGMANSYRHFLGMNKAIKLKPKVQLLKEEMETRYPNLNVISVEKEVLEVIDEGEINLNEYDLIIVAVGDPNIERKLNELIYKTSTPTIFTWVEAYGIGGHALLVNNGDNGCYECLIDNDLQIKSSFASRSDKPYIQNINGCAGSFTPYGSVDSMETALIASRLILRFLNGDIEGNPLVSWKGSANEFRSHGFKTSKRYDEPSEKLAEPNYDYIETQCPICKDKVVVSTS
ncbi:hypothetical protein E2K98_24690 [Bacillus salipaludis]|uniref:THIF-type NAD/FAD binding fold domain-containing protein n=1 Tax=Bacillus salipaludis TaxID=2547811 RepID=A0A4V3AT32_9BACI|nr:ThiF family adenylyltransferase [Bacillus salipaludis]TDK58118.1 hypothetical protein E2K98_24690 [Bacillus salipaludis]